MLREVPFGNDGDFSHTQAVQRINSDLANGFGNLVQRTLSMIFKNCDGKIPLPGEFAAEDRALLAQAREKLLPAMREELDGQRFHKALEVFMLLVYDANAYIDCQAPWALKKTYPARMGTVLYVLAEVIRCLAIAIQPVTPVAAGKILDQLLVSADARSFRALNEAHALAAGTEIPQPAGIFPRIVQEDETAKQAAALAGSVS